MKRASAYLRENRIFIQAEARTTAGLWIGTGPVALTSPDDPQEISRLLIACLDASKDGVPHPKEWAGFLKPFLSAVGVRSWKAFVKGAKHVGIGLEEWVVTLEPYRNDGAKDGFTPLSNKTRTVPQDSADLGIELLAAFAEAQ